MTDPRWQAPSGRRDTAGRAVPDPLRPLGAQPPASVAIGQYAPPRRPTGWIIAGAALLLAAVLAFWVWGPTRQATPTPTPSPTPSATPSPSTGQPFGNPSGDLAGSWEVDSYQWTTEGLEMLITVRVEKGTLSASISGFGNVDLQQAQTLPTRRSPALNLDRVTAGDEQVGWVLLDVPRGATTVILASETREQLSALLIDG